MPFFHYKKGGKTQRRKQDCSYENVDFHELPKLHSLVLGEASTAKLKGFISKKVSNINETDKHGRTALHYAASIGNEKALNILLQCGLTVDLEKKDDEGKTALFKAVEVFSANCVHVLLEHKAATDVWDNHKSTPLHIATVNRKTVIVSLISKANGNLSIKDKMGFSPLHVAAAFGYLETAKELIDCGADINAKDGLGRTPLMAAACEGTPKMVHLLLGYGADPSIKDNFNHTAIDHSKQNQSESMTKIIKEAVAQRGFVRVDSTEAEAIASTDGQNSSGSKDDKELDFSVDQPTTEPEIVIKVDRVDDSDDLGVDQEFPQDIKKGSDLNEIIEDVQKATDVNIAQASSFNIDVEDEINEPDQSDPSELVQHSLLYDDDLRTQNSEQDGPFEPSFQLQQDSLNLLQKKRASQGDPKANVQKRVSFSSDNENHGKQHRLTLMKNRRLKEENTRLKSHLNELLKETNLETEKQQKELEIKKSQLQFINMKNKMILEEKIKQCSKLEIKLKEAHYHLISEIEKAREGSNLEDITKDMIQDLNRRLKSSDMRIDRLLNQLKSSREEKYLLETEIGSLKGKIAILQEIVNKKNNEKSFFEKLTADRIKELDNDESLMFYKEEYERTLMENKTLQDSLNKLRMENAMLKEQHLSDKHEAQMIKNELAESQEQVITLQYQLENMKNQNKDTISYRDLLDRSSIDRSKLRHEDLQRVRNINIERAKSDSTLHGFRTFDSSVFVGSDYDSNQSNQRKYHAADLTGMQ